MKKTIKQLEADVLKAAIAWHAARIVSWTYYCTKEGKLVKACDRLAAARKAKS